MMNQKTMNVSEPITIFFPKVSLDLVSSTVGNSSSSVNLCFECVTRGIGGAGMLSLVKGNLVDFLTVFPLYMQFKPIMKNSV